MKKLLLIPILFLLINSFGQSNVNRAGPANTVGDQRLRAVKNFYVPVYADTITANITSSTLSNNNIGEDSCGALIYTYDVDGYWVRRCFPSKHWERFTSGGQIAILPSCGLGNNGITTTGFITYDSTGSGGAVFDVKGGPYALCCDHQARLLHDTVIVIKTPIDSLNPAFVSIYLGASGVSIVTGTPNANPEVPQSPDSCALLLTYILFNGGQTTPAFVTSNNPLSIYDENYHPPEWTLSFDTLLTIDTANTAFPIHLTHAIFVNGYSAGNYFELKTDSNINLNDYGAFKFYVREADASTLRLNITWYLDDVPQTTTIQAPIQSGLTGVYQTIVMSTANWNFIGTSTAVNKIRISVQTGGAAGFYLDWLQLQRGIPSPASPLGVTQITMGNLDPLFNGQVSNPTTQPALSFIQQPAPANRILGRFSNTAGAYSFGQVDLSTPEITGLLPIANIAIGANGSFLSTQGGNNQWVIPASDTIYARNWLRLTPDGNGNDTLDFGSRFPDSSLLRFDTYVGLNNHSFNINRDSINPVFQLDAVNQYYSIGDVNNAYDGDVINIDEINQTVTITARQNILFNILDSSNQSIITGEGVRWAGSQSYSIAAPISTYQVPQNAYFIGATGTFNVTLPDAAINTGKVYVIKNIGAGSITVNTTSSQNIDGSTTYPLASQYKYVTVISNGAQWFIISNN